MNLLFKIGLSLWLIFISTYEINSKLIVQVTEEQFGEILKDDDIVVILVNAKAPSITILPSSFPTFQATNPQSVQRIVRGGRRTGNSTQQFGLSTGSVFGSTPQEKKTTENQEKEAEEAIEYTCFIEKGGFYFSTTTTNLVWDKQVHRVIGKTIANSSTINLKTN